MGPQSGTLKPGDRVLICGDHVWRARTAEVIGELVGDDGESLWTLRLDVSKLPGERMTTAAKLHQLIADPLA